MEKPLAEGREASDSVLRSSERSLVAVTIGRRAGRDTGTVSLKKGPIFITYR